MRPRSCFLLVFCLLLAGCGGAPGDAERPSIAVSLFPLADLTAQLVGEDADVHTLLPAGRSPHGFEPSPRTLARLADAEAVITVGLGLDSWAKAPATSRRLVMAEMIPAGLRAAVAREATGDAHLDPHDHDHHHHHDHGPGPDPHLWLDPLAAQAFVVALADELAIVLPGAGDRIADRRDALVAELDRLDAECRAALGKVGRRQLVTFHDAFDRFAHRYGLEVVAHLTELELAPGGEIKPQRLVTAIEAIRRHGLPVVYTEPQMPPAAAEALARETGVTVLRLDPIGGPDINGADGYLALMRSNLQVLVRGQSIDAPGTR